MAIGKYHEKALNKISIYYTEGMTFLLWKSHYPDVMVLNTV